VKRLKEMACLRRGWRFRNCLTGLIGLIGLIGISQAELCQAELCQAGLSQAGLPNDPQLSVAANGVAQDEELDEMKMLQQLDQWLQQLQAPDLKDREIAEQKMLELGPVILDYLEFSEDQPTDVKERLARIRSQLEKVLVLRFNQPTTIQLQGKHPLATLLAAISQQTGNRVQLSQRVSAEIADQSLDVDWQQIHFWDAVHQVMQAGGLTPDSYAGNARELMLRPMVPAVPLAAIAPQEAPLSPVPMPLLIPRGSAGVFDVTVNRVLSVLDFANPGSSSTQITLVIRWEPRLQPISVDVPFRSLVLRDQLGKEIPIQNRDRIFHGVVQGEMPGLEFNLPIDAKRDLREIQSLEAELLAVMPGKVETFRFRKVGTLKDGAEIQKAGATVVFEGVAKNQDLYGLTITLKFDESYHALESHQAWVFENPIFLEDEQGNRIEPLTLEGVRQSGNAVTIRYYFRDQPQDYQLVYQTVSAIVQQSIPFRIENIILP
jgi:adenylate kinase family enzyme